MGSLRAICTFFSICTFNWPSTDVRDHTLLKISFCRSRR